MEMSECDIYPFVAGEDNDLTFAASGTKGFGVPTPEVKGHLKQKAYCYSYFVPFVYSS